MMIFMYVWHVVMKVGQILQGRDFYADIQGQKYPLL